MPWPEKQRRAIFLSVQRRKGTAAAKRVMHEAGYGKKKRKRKRDHKAEVHAIVRELRG
jgi:hypothetical protein